MTTTDRGDIIHFAGFHHLSPAIDAQRAPVLAAEHGGDLARCGWQTFFRAMGERGLAVAFDPADGGSARFVASAQGSDDAASHGGGLGHAIEHAKRFWKAYRGG